MKLMNLAATLFMTAALIAHADEKDKPSPVEPRTQIFSDARIGLVFRADSTWSDLGHDADSGSPEVFLNKESRLKLAISKIEGVDRNAARETALGLESGIAKGLTEFHHDSLEMNDARDIATLRFEGKRKGASLRGLAIVKLQDGDALVFLMLGNDDNADQMKPTMDRALAGIGSMDFSAEAAKAVAGKYCESLQKADADGFFSCLNLNAMAEAGMPGSTKEQRLEAMEKMETGLREKFKQADPELVKQGKVEMGEMKMRGTQAMVPVTMTRPDGTSEVSYLILSPTLDGWRISDILVKDDKADNTNLH